MRWHLVASRGGANIEVSGTAGEQDEPLVLDFIAAVREGLEANGYEVSASIGHTTTLEV